ncbi:MAG: hypothetical protein KDM63_10995, partial [Verrucomicrobiae bacterium]|nr:hypothetical protein [Verrucomicrobiae bacterium]
EVRLYYGGSDYLHFGWRTGSLCLATLRPDGFAGYEPTDPGQPTVITTQPIPWTGEPIRISADVSAGGSIAVSVIGSTDAPPIHADPVLKTVTDGPLQWSGPIPNGAIRLRFEVKGAKLYSFSWEKR